MIEDRLQEIDQGGWTGTPWFDVYTDDVIAQIDERQLDFAVPGESIREVGRRMHEWLREVVQTQHQDSVVAFTHGMAIRALAGRVDGWSHERIRSASTPNCSLTTFEAEGSSLRLVDVGRVVVEVS